MSNVNISFYLKSGGIRIFSDALKKIGSPSRICLLLSKDGKSLLITPYEKRDLKSHRVPNDVYCNSGKMEIYSLKLCEYISHLRNWESNISYRVPGKVLPEKNYIVYDLTKAIMIMQ